MVSLINSFKFLFDLNHEKALFFTKPQELIIAREISEIENAFERIETAIENGKYAAGFFSYELGYGFEDCLKPLLPKKRKLPLIYFGIFAKPCEISQANYEELLLGNDYILGAPSFELSQKLYTKKFAKIKSAIKKGDFYQTNFTFKLKYGFSGSPETLYLDLKKNSQIQNGGFLQAKEFSILSLSPELGFEIKNGKITTRPMKGTAPRGLTEVADNSQKIKLLTDEKQRAENLMIVDLLRNDLSRIAKKSSVKVEKLFHAEKYPSLWQMVSIIVADLRENLKMREIIKAFFPSGSITGAPKIEAMKKIRALEKGAREIYCGSLGFFSRDFSRFNVAIRTGLVKGGKLEMGIGSGLVNDSKANEEYKETLLKARFLENIRKDFSLIETFGFEEGVENPFIAHHFKRLENSAKKFGFDFKRQKLLAAFETFSKNLKGKNRVRLLLHQNGILEFSAAELEENPPKARVKISKNRIDSKNPWLRHKTTNRHFYDGELQNAIKEGFFEVIFQNEKGEICEGARSNIFLDMGDGILLTPPQKSGLLNGILRQNLLKNGRAKEKIILESDLHHAKTIYIGNSLRGLIEVGSKD